MANVLSVVAAALHADQSRLEQASINASNAATPGFKRSSLVAVAFDQVMASQESSEALHQGRRDWMPSPPSLRKITDLSQGGLIQTSRALDVAVEGKAFMAVTDGNRTWLTRTASMQVNAQGELVGPRGLRVVGVEGDLKPGTDQNVAINAMGQLMRGDQVVGRIKLLETSPDAAMDSSDGILFEVSPDALRDASPEHSVVRGGFLEGSNTNNLKEMLGVMENVRHFESLIRLAQGYDEALGKAIQKLGEV